MHVVYGLTAFTNLNDQIVKNIIARVPNFILVAFSNYIIYAKEKRNKREQKKIYIQHPQINALHACKDMYLGPYKICPLYNSHATILKKYRDTRRLQATVYHVLSRMVLIVTLLQSLKNHQKILRWNFVTKQIAFFLKL